MGGVQARGDGYGEVHAAIVAAVAVFAPGRHVVGLHHLIALHGFQMDVEAPQTMQMLEHFFSGIAQGFAVVLLVAKGQRAVATAVDAPDLHVGFAIAKVVLSCQQLADDPVAGLVMDGGYQQVVALIVVEDAEQLEVTDHLG